MDKYTKQDLDSEITFKLTLRDFIILSWGDGRLPQGSRDDESLPVAACNRNGLDLQSSRFSTGIDCVYPSQQTGIICE
ncbi:hypothetical protein [Pseudomonas amygdali]|uniref:hypothetical protein n=1 Tax=Pseudomonas amygdali TaxID=47877 RepID=UPI0007607766|nr:hypothetical protein [Pseudomonas amygdali]KWT09950.1 hypothetical protein AL041_19795 [Pseudomonas amygdali pv. aesculi]KWT24576.1 hypothetical protein AL042_18655 [Pseudomonas amygdali pv. aesculi]KWT28673.1 hypothetical protein AL044_15805 [Pseudomonas amygdali pv. aesculi]KWT31042.1 hypothetical protein AL045_08360 [Pseudomonas amygdali pv. aesculi]KWT39415.1 hypothetical protein AMC94_18635 [Pseudomonas amygdali pv. aesculi]